MVGTAVKEGTVVRYQDEAVLRGKVVGNRFSSLSVEVVRGLVYERIDAVCGKEICEHQLGPLTA